MGNKIWGWSTHVDCSGCLLETIEDKEHMETFLRVMVQELDMVAMTDPWVMWCDTNDPQKIGYSGYILLQDSNISFHMCSATAEAYFDVFSCKPYDPEIVYDLIQKFFFPTGMHHRVLDRAAP